MSTKIPNKSRPHIVIILPTYNEAENIGELIKQLSAVFKRETGYEFSILVVDDTSPDNTAGIVKNLQKKQSNISLLLGEKRGLGAAYIRGMHYAVDRMHADILFQMDSDLSHDPAVVPSFLRKLEKGADYVVGSRYIPGGSIPENWGADRKLFSVVGNFIIRFGLMIPRIHEWTSGYRAMRVEVFKKISEGLEKYRGYIFQIASMHRVVKAHFAISEVPINFIDRKYGTSKIIPKEYIPDVLRYILLNSSFVRFFVTGLFGFGLDFSIAAFLIYMLQMFEPTANAMSSAVAVSSNFIINNYWSFNHKKISGGVDVYIRKYVQFVIVAVGSVGIQWLGMYVSLHTLGDQDIVLGTLNIHSWVVYKVFIIAFFIIPYSYLMYNRVIWRAPSR
ncbi:MAG: glycosyltransferase [Candidatus Roizmanbacteria bacterium]|nr:glycosyltransferase [Candidatus Roizmanbacteria bacterium]